MSKSKSMTPEAIAARERRCIEWEAKRFNVTLKEYIEVKHDSIYDEYCSFYKTLSEEYPNKRNLLSTSKFKAWKKQTIERAFQDDGLTARVTFFSDHEGSQVSDSEEAEDSTVSDNEVNNNNNNNNEDSAVADNEVNNNNEDSTVADNEVNNNNEDSFVGDVLSLAIEETLSGYVNPVEDINMDEIPNVDSVIDGIIAELERDDQMRGILNDDDDIAGQYDEGIALDFETELEAIVESFDYEQEVDFF